MNLVARSRWLRGAARLDPTIHGLRRHAQLRDSLLPRVDHAFDGCLPVLRFAGGVRSHLRSPRRRPSPLLQVRLDLGPPLGEGDDEGARNIGQVTKAEIAFCGLGPIAETFIKRAAATGATKLGPDLDELAGLEAAHGRDALIAALERAVAFGRFRAADVRSILAAGTGVAKPTRPGEALIVALPTVATRPLSDYAIGHQS